jgi:hypothetical protein
MRRLVTSISQFLSLISVVAFSLLTPMFVLPAAADMKQIDRECYCSSGGLFAKLEQIISRHLCQLLA